MPAMMKTTMYDSTPVIERSEDIAPPPTSIGLDGPVSAIIVRYRDEKVLMQRIPEYKFAIAYAVSAFDSLAGKSHERFCLATTAKERGSFARIDERLWPLLADTIPEVTLYLLPSPDAASRRRKKAAAEARLKLITEIATSPVTIAAAGDEYPLEINLVSATVIELKRVIERKLGLPVSQQQLFMQMPREGIWPAEDDDILASVGVMRGSRIPLGIKRASW